MTLVKCCKNKKGVALMYAVMVLFLLATVVVAITALASTSYSEAVLTASDDQSFFYAKSIGLAVKEQFKDGYNVSDVINSLDRQIDDDSSVNPVVTGRYYVEDKNGTEMVEGTVNITYAKDSSSGEINKNVLEVRVACVYNNSLSIVTSVFSCEEDADDVISKVKNAYDYYDVILTNKDEVNFNFANTNGPVRVYVYAGEDDTVVCPPFYLGVNMSGALTTTGAVKIRGGENGASAQKTISGDLTAYGDIELTNIKVKGAKGIHSDGSVTLHSGTFVDASIFSRGDILLESPGTSRHAAGYIHNYGVNAAGRIPWEGGDGIDIVSSPKAQATNLVALGSVTMEEFSYISGSIYARGNVTLTGRQNLHFFNTWVNGNVYSNGNVTLSAGAVVYGNVSAEGTVSISKGAVVFGNVKAKGDVKIQGGVVGGKVECLGTLTLQSYQGSTQYGWWINQKFNTGIYSGIGLLRGIDSNHTASGIVHSCGALSLGRSDYYVTIYGDLYVENGGPSNSKYTVLECVAMTDTLYLKNSRAIFGSTSDQSTSYYQCVSITRIRQNKDFYFTSSNKLVNMNGAAVGIIEAGDASSPLDIYAMNGWITIGIIGRCAELKMMKFNTNVNLILKQYLKMYGTGTATSLCSDGFVNLPSGSSIWVTCESGSYSGSTANSNVGLDIGNYVACHAGTTIYVGSEEGSGKGTVTLGDNAAPAQTHIASIINADVQNFTIGGATHLPAAGMNVQVTGKLTVQNTSSFGVDRTDSVINVRGDVNLQGDLYNLFQFSGDFTNSATGRVRGIYWSDSSGTLKFRGTFGSIEASNSDCTVELSAALTITNNIRINGAFNNNGNYKLTVGGDLYVGRLSSAGKLKNVEVSGNVKVASPGSSFTVDSNVIIRGTLICESADVTLDKGTVGGVTGKTLTVKTGATLGGASTNKSYITYGFTMSGGTMNACSVRCQSFTQTGGTLNSVKMYVSGTGTSINISGKAAGSVCNFYAPNGAFSVTGGTGISYTGKNTIHAKNTSKVEGRFRAGITITNGNLTIGNDSDTAYYDVGIGATTIYASGTVTWRGMARSTYDSTPGSGAFIVAAGGNVTIGSAEKPVNGLFHKISSTNGNVVAYVDKVDEGIYAAGSVTVKITGYLGKSDKMTNTKYGINAGGTINLSASNSGAKYYGTIVSGGKLTIASALSMCAQIKCPDIEGVDKITEEYSSSLGQNALYVSLQITGSSSSAFELKHSLAKDSSGTTGSITLENRPFKLTSGKHVEGYIYVNGIYTYGSSTVNLDSIGGVYCKNTEVNAVNLKGAIELPNVTTITIGSDISSLKADKVTSLTLSRNFGGSLSLPNLTTLTVNSGITVGGALEVTGATLTNNGTINGGAKCKKYTGSGVVKGNLIIIGTEESTISGNVEANVYANCSLKLQNATSLGSDGSYIYSKKSINATSVTFHKDMNYIMSSGGDMNFTNCKQMPNIRAVNGAGAIKFVNESEALRGTIKSVWSKATSIRFGTGTTNNYQTVTGTLQWGGSVATTEYGVKIRSQNTKIQGVTKLIGTGKVEVKGYFSTDVFLHNIGGYANFSGGYTDKNLYVNVYKNNNNDVRVTDFVTDSSSVINKDLFIYGNGQSFTLNCKVNRMLRADNVHLKVKGNVGGQILHTASIFGYIVELGTKNTRITVGGDISTRGYLIDNSQNTGKITVLGYYYGDVNKKYSGCTAIRLSQDTDASGAKVGWTWIFGGSSADTLNGNIDVEGWLFIYSNSNNKQFTINGNIYCNNLTINHYHYGGQGNYNQFVYSGFGRNDKDILTCIQSGLLPVPTDYGSKLFTMQSTSKDRVVVKEIHVTAGHGYLGSAYCANTKMNHLRTEGQISLTYCYLMSKNFNDSTYSSTGQHCSVNGNRVDTGDGSIMAHTKNTDNGWNIFYGVNTKSNISLFYGYTWVGGGTVFEGSVKENLAAGGKGNVATKLFYFGAGLSIFGSSKITAARNESIGKSNAPSARTIVWVAGGDLLVEYGSYIGSGNVPAGKSSKGYLDRNNNSSHPGVFVSAGSANIYGCVTLDMYVRYDLNVRNAGVVIGKQWTDNNYYYKGGVYIAGGGLNEIDGGWLALLHAKSGNRAYESGKSSWNFTPSSSDIADYIHNYGDMHVSYSNASDCSTYYNPVSSASSITVGKVDGAKMTYGASFTNYFTPGGRTSDENDYYDSQINGYSAPSQPSLSTSGGFGVAAVPPLQIASTSVASSNQNYTVSNVAKPSVGAASDSYEWNLTNAYNWANLTNFSFSGMWNDGPGKVNYASMFGNWDTKTIKVKINDEDVAFTLSQHLDKTNSDLWGPRVIPMTWQLPNQYMTDSGTTTTTPANRVLVGKEFSGGDIELSGTGSTVAQDKHYVTEDIYNYSSNNLKTYNQGSLFNDRKNTAGTSYSGTSKLLDYIKRYHTSDDDNPRLADLLIFESGELPYSAFYRDGKSGDDFTLWSRLGRGHVNETHTAHYGVDRKWDYFFWKYYVQKRYDGNSGWYTKNTSLTGKGKLGDWEDEFAVTYPKQQQIPYYQYHGNSSKTIAGQYQDAWFWSSEAVGNYNVNWIFYACQNPKDPYGSAAKDLHIVLPKGIGVEFMRDINNKILVLGRGRVFLYLTSGDTLYFRGDLKSDTEPTTWYVGGLTNKNSKGNYLSSDKQARRPQLYIIGAGTNIDLIIREMQLMAYVYMPFGTSNALYNSSSGKLKWYNRFSDITTNSKANNPNNSTATRTTAVTSVKRNALTLVWDNAKNKRLLYGSIVTDNFCFTSGSDKQLQFASYPDRYGPDFSDTTIYGPSTYSGSSTTNFSAEKVTVSLTKMMAEPPGYSTTMLNWKYVGMKVVN